MRVIHVAVMYHAIVHLEVTDEFPLSFVKGSAHHAEYHLRPCRTGFRECPEQTIKVLIAVTPPHIKIVWLGWDRLGSIRETRINVWGQVCNFHLTFGQRVTLEQIILRILGDADYCLCRHDRTALFFCASALGIKLSGEQLVNHVP